MATPKTPIDAEALRKKLMADPTTQGIAKNLGVDLNGYVEKVVYFAMNPDAEPTFEILSDEKIKEMGHTPPNEEAMLQYVKDVIAIGKVADHTEYTDPKKKLIEIDSPLEPSNQEADAELKTELDKQLRGKRGGNG